MIKIEINSKETELNDCTTIQSMLKQISYEGKMFVIEKNLKIIDKDKYETCIVEDGDKIEIVAFVGGG